jgi:hypothetical protein
VLPGDIVNNVNIVSTSEREEEEAATSPLAAALAALERHCPDHIKAADWQRAVEDGRRFLMQWGERATALGWVESDVFGLPLDDRFHEFGRLRGILPDDIAL